VLEGSMERAARHLQGRAQLRDMNWLLEILPIDEIFYIADKLGMALSPRLKLARHLVHNAESERFDEYASAH
jgi:hypothetical protein